MGRCIICGTAVDGRICDTHEEDVVFEFRGTRPEQLTPGRFYEGSVDGYADFGVFVDVGDSVTGLLHQSEIEPRLESLDWEPGDTVYVQVLRVRDNGDVDLGWSIRERERDFRGKLIDDPDTDTEHLPETEETTDGSASESTERSDETDRSPETDQTDETDRTGETDRSPEADQTEDTDRSGGAADADSAAEPGQGDSRASADDSAVANGGGGAAVAQREAPAERVTVDSLADRVGDRVAVECEVVSVRQTGGPTIFEVRDESAVADVAAFEAAGVRAYPEVETGDHVRVVGEVERRREDLQVESESVDRLEGEDAEAVRERLDAALDDQARPDPVDLLADDDAVEGARDVIVDAATAIRRAVLEARPVIVRHTATADGYVAGAAIERAVLPLIRDEHAKSDAEYHYFDRRPLEGTVYDMDDATADVSSMLEDRERHDEPLPLVVVVDAGSTVESLEGYELLSIYGVEHLVIDAADADDDVAETVSTVVDADSSADLTTAVLASNVAVHVNDGVREDLAHLPAVSYWEDPPAAYRDLAADAGYDEATAQELREAVALSAYYQTYEDKRQLVVDLLFGEATPEGDARGLASHVSEQFREKVDDAVSTAEANAEVREAGGVRFTVLDADAFADGYEFPPTALLVDELHRRTRGGADHEVTLAVTTDELHVRTDEDLDLRAVADHVDSVVENAGVRAVGGDGGHLEFVAGERDAVLREAVAAVADLV
ncbi:DNA-binding protein [Halobacteriales archaeon QS_1_68_20]|nr:MAG: DNA-binding protein [Halobacteriales archaeon QS_1_68_20]